MGEEFIKVTDRQTDRQTDTRTELLPELLSELKKQTNTLTWDTEVTPSTNYFF